MSSNFNSTTQQVNKWWVLLSGLLFLFLGLYICNTPGQAAVSFIYYIAFVKIISGLVGLFTNMKHASNDRQKWFFFISLFDLLFGILLLCSSVLQLSLLMLMPIYFGIWAVIRGLFMVIAGFKNKKYMDNFWGNLIVGILYFIAGIYVFTNPIKVTIAAWGVLGLFFLFIGIISIVQFIFLLISKKR